MSKLVFGIYELSNMVLGFRRVQNDDLQYCTRSKGTVLGARADYIYLLTEIIVRVTPMT